MTVIIPAVLKEAETQRCIPAVHSKFRSEIWESSLAVSCAVFATSAQGSVCDHLTCVSCLEMLALLVPPTAGSLCPVESLSNRKPRQFLNCCEYHRPSGHIDENSHA